MLGSWVRAPRREHKPLPLEVAFSMAFAPVLVPVSLPASDGKSEYHRLHSNRRFRKDSVPPESSHPRPLAPYPMHSLPIHTAPPTPITRYENDSVSCQPKPGDIFTRPANTNRKRGFFSPGRAGRCGLPAKRMANCLKKRMPVKNGQHNRGYDTKGVHTDCPSKRITRNEALGVRTLQDRKTAAIPHPAYGRRRNVRCRRYVPAAGRDAPRMTAPWSARISAILRGAAASVQTQVPQPVPTFEVIRRIGEYHIEPFRCALQVKKSIGSDDIEVLHTESRSRPADKIVMHRIDLHRGDTRRTARDEFITDGTRPRKEVEHFGPLQVDGCPSTLNRFSFAKSVVRTGPQITRRIYHPAAESTAYDSHSTA